MKKLLHKLKTNWRVYQHDIAKKGLYWSVVHRLYKVPGMRRVLTPLTNMLKPSYVLVRGYKLYVDKWDMEGAMIAKLIVVAWTLFVGYGYVGGIFEAATANPINGVFVVGLVVSSAGHLALWMVVALPTYMISRMFNRGQQPHPKVQRGWYD